MDEMLEGKKRAILNAIKILCESFVWKIMGSYFFQLSTRLISFCFAFMRGQWFASQIKTVGANEMTGYIK